MIWLMTTLWTAAWNPSPIALDIRWRQELGDYDIYASRALAVSGRGEVAVIERTTPLIAILNPDGSLKAKIDRPGQGPGELQGPVEIGWIAAAEAFAVLDFANRRVSLWTAEGRFVKETPYVSGALFAPQFGGADAMFCARNPGGMNGAPSLIRYDLASRETTELWRRDPPTHEWSVAGDSANPIRVRFRWDPQLLFGLGGDFIAVLFNDGATIELLNRQGKPMRKLRLNMPRYEITAAQVQEGIELLPVSFHASLKQGVRPPESWPMARALYVDPKDRIWAIGASRDVGAAHPFTVLDKTGRQLGAGTVAQVPNAVAGDALYYFENGEEDGFYLVKAGYRLEG